MFRWLPVSGAYQWDGIIVQRLDGEPFRATDLRTLPWRHMLGNEVRDRMDEAERVISINDLVEEFGTPDAAATWERNGRAELADLAAVHRGKLKRASRTRYDDAHYQAVAHHYDVAMRHGSAAPVKFVARAMNSKPSTVKNWIAECRKRGLLPPTDERKPKGNIG
jgi:hypothetical protein